MSFADQRSSKNVLLAILENAREATVVFISDELHIGFINLSMMQLWQKKQPVLNQRLIDAAPEFAPFIPTLQQVWTTGKTYTAVDTPANIDHDGVLIERYFDFEYRPVFNDHGDVYAIINTATDVTDRREASMQLRSQEEKELFLQGELLTANRELTVAQDKLVEINAELQLHASRLAETERFLRRFIMQAPAALTLLSGPQLTYSIVNTKYQEILAGRALNGRSIFDAVPELVGTQVETMLRDVYRNGNSYSLDDTLILIADEEAGPTRERYFTFNFAPWIDTNGSINGVLNLAYEVTDQVRSRQSVAELNDELLKVNDRLNMATTSGKIGTWYIEPGGNILSYNTVLAEIFGYDDPIPMTYEQALEQIVPEDMPLLMTEIKRAITERDAYDATYRIKRFSDERVIWLRSTGQVAATGEGCQIAFSGVVQDITRQREEELRKDTFISMVSHELKTPLTSLNGFLQILHTVVAKTDSTFATGLLDKAQVQVVRMTKLINGFLNVSRLESGKIYIDKQAFDLADLVKEIEDESRATFNSHKLIFDRVVPAMVYADRDKIGQVLTNLVSNAIKYSPAGSKVHISYINDGANAILTVADEGFGIAPADVEKLFDRYYRVEGQAMKTIAGFGIGLYLCKEIVEQHHGHIGVNSTLGAGSEFWFSIPLVRS